MAKEAYYFSHDSNARHDPKITAMRGVYGSEGYAWFFMFIEMMRETDGYKLDMQSRYAFNAYAMQMHSNSDAIASFVHDCVNEFELFASDGINFWSESLLRRMDKAHEKSQKAKESANARWKKKQENTNASNSNANASKMDAIKESKEKESKGKEITQVHVPVFDNPHNDRIETYLKKYKVEYIIMQLEDICSFVGAVSLEVIEYAIASSEGKTAAYAVSILKRLLSEGKTEIEQVNPKPKVGDNVVQFGEGIRQGFTNEHDRPYEEQPEWKLPDKYRTATDLSDVSGH